MHGHAMKDSHDRARDLMACVGDPSRFRVLVELQGRELCVTDLAGRVGLSQSCTTRHLQALNRAGVVERRRDGKRVVFSVARGAQVAGLMAWALGSARRRTQIATKAQPVPSNPPAARPAPATRVTEPVPVPEAEPVQASTGERSERKRDLEDYLL